MSAVALPFYGSAFSVVACCLSADTRQCSAATLAQQTAMPSTEHRLGADFIDRQLVADCMVCFQLIYPLHAVVHTAQCYCSLPVLLARHVASHCSFVWGEATNKFGAAASPVSTDYRTCMLLAALHYIIRFGLGGYFVFENVRFCERG